MYPYVKLELGGGGIELTGCKLGTSPAEDDGSGARERPAVGCGSGRDEGCEVCNWRGGLESWADVYGAGAERGVSCAGGNEG